MWDYLRSWAARLASSFVLGLLCVLFALLFQRHRVLCPIRFYDYVFVFSSMNVFTVQHTNIYTGIPIYIHTVVLYALLQLHAAWQDCQMYMVRLGGILDLSLHHNATYFIPCSCPYIHIDSKGKYYMNQIVTILLRVYKLKCKRTRFGYILALIVNGALVNALQICDLGSARRLEYTQLQTTAVGTCAWMAPEVSTAYIHDFLS